MCGKRLSRQQSHVVFATVLSAFFLLHCGSPPPSQHGEPTNAPGSSTSTSDPNAAPGVGFRGRFDARDPNHKRFSWPNSGIVVRFTGPSLSVNLGETQGWWWDAVHQVNGVCDSEYDVTIDGGTPKRLVTDTNTTSYVLADGLDATATHTVSLIRRTEGSIGIGAFGGIALGSGGTLLPPPSPPTRRIEFVGDSELPGYGADASVEASNMCTFTPDTEDADASVAKATAELLQADFMNTAYSGKGITRNLTTGDTVYIPELYTRSVATDGNTTWDWNTWAADVVVLDAGANDMLGNAGQRYYPDPNQFMSAYASFVGTLRQKYPHAPIFCVMSAAPENNDRTTMLAVLQQAVTQIQRVGDSNVFFFDYFATDPNNTSYADAQASNNLGFGCDFHPSAAGAKFLGGRLAAAIKQQMKW